VALVIRPQVDTPQERAAKSRAQILVYGGGAGGGKSWFQSYQAAKYHKTKGYSAALFRRTFTMLQGSGSLWDECLGFYPALGASYTTKPLEFKWPAPARVEFRHLQHEASAQEHKSKQYAFIGFDEATDFTGAQFTFMVSRLRTTCGVPTQMVLTTNPDPDSYLRTWVDWWISSDGTPDHTRSGKLRYWCRDKDEVIWADSREALAKYVDDVNTDVMSMTFIPATVYDNKILLEKDPTYLGKLKSLPKVERDRFLGGNWDVKESAGDLFQRSWFQPWGFTELERVLMGQDGPGAHVVQSVRWWDFAATPVKGDLVPGIERPGDFKAREPTTADGDWSVGVRLDRTADGRVIIGDVQMWRDTPGAIEAAVERAAMLDGPRTTVGGWDDGGQAGASQSERLAARLSKHALVVCEPSSKSKLEYAREPSRSAYRGELHFVQGKWNSPFFNQLEQFPSKDEHDDAVDALSGAWHYLTQNPPWAAEHPLIIQPTGWTAGMPGFFLPPSRADEMLRKGGGVSRFGGRRI
jgi:predicted phage terminase large subunit-like protein